MRHSKTSVLFLLLILFLCVGFTDVAYAWERYEVQSGNFSVILPDTPKIINEFEEPLPTGKFKGKTFLSILGDDLMCVITYMEFSPEYVAEMKDKSTLRTLAEATLIQGKNELIFEKTFLYEGLKGREYQLTGSDFYGTARTLWISNKLYVLSAFSKLGIPLNKQSSKYLDSFKAILHDPPSSSQDIALDRFMSEDGNFSVKNVGSFDYEIITMNIPNKGPTKMHYYQASDGSMAYQVSYSDFSIDRLNSITADDLFDKTRDAAVLNVNGTLLYETIEKVSGHPARRVCVSSQNGRVQMLSINVLVGNRFFSYGVAYPTELISEPRIEDFIKSFVITEKQSN